MLHGTVDKFAVMLEYLIWVMEKTARGITGELGNEGRWITIHQ